MNVDQAIITRHAVRAFLNTPIDLTILQEILTIACRAPSGTNMQPWKVYVVMGQKKEALCKEVCDIQYQIYNDSEIAQNYQETFNYYPKQWISPYIERRRANGWGLYSLLNIQKGEKEKIFHQQLKNFKLFNAPVGLFFTVNQTMEIGAKMDIAMMIQNVMLVAKARGLDTCPQAAWNPFHKIVLKTINAPKDEELVCTVALGYADPTDIVNSFATPREPLENFVTFVE